MVVRATTALPTPANEVTFFTRAYGLSIRANQRIPGLRNYSQTPGFVDLDITFDSLPQDLVNASDEIWKPHSRFRSRRPYDQNDNPILRVTETEDRCYTRLAYRNGLEFTFSSDATHLWITYPDRLSMETVSAFLLNPALGFNLRLREITCMHATAIVVDNYVMLVGGVSGAGKSTTASYFALRQHPILSDDVSALCLKKGDVFVQPGVPLLRLWPQSTQALLGEGSALPRISPDWEKQYLSLETEGFRFADEAMPIGAVYILGPRNEELSIRPLRPAESLMILIDNTYLDYLVDNRLRAVDMEMLATLVDKIPVRHVTPQNKLDNLPILYDALLEDFYVSRNR